MVPTAVGQDNPHCIETLRDSTLLVTAVRPCGYLSARTSPQAHAKGYSYFRIKIHFLQLDLLSSVLLRVRAGAGRSAPAGKEAQRSRPRHKFSISCLIQYDVSYHISSNVTITCGLAGKNAPEGPRELAQPCALRARGGGRSVFMRVCIYIYIYIYIMCMYMYIQYVYVCVYVCV